ncbi:MANSC domain-containing protein 1-like isoform X2 [Ptychodera flava]|uniref:MANSC domain-containing protein 1-like isoform X2 n=1 Tax=Ptychodera flava TaxID=63121 RepID=UPI00396A06F2
MPGLHTFRSFILLLCLMVMVSCELVENDMCTFDVQEGQVVDMKSSKKQEGLFEMLNATHPETLEECYNSCCDVCTVVSFAVEDDSPNCYQFWCDPPESCVFTDNDGFTSVIVRLKGFEDSEGEVDGGVVEEADVFDWSTPEPEASTAVDQTTQKDSTSVMNTEEGNGEISDSNQGIGGSLHALPENTSLSVIGDGNTTQVNISGGETASKILANETTETLSASLSPNQNGSMVSPSVAVSESVTNKSDSVTAQSFVTTENVTSSTSATSVSMTHSVTNSERNSSKTDTVNPQNASLPTNSSDGQKETVTPTKTTASVTTVVDNEEPTTQERVETTQAEALTTSQTEAQTTSQTEQMSTMAHTTVQPVITSGAATQQAVTTETGSGGSGSSSEEFEDYTDHNETTGSFGHRMSDQTSTGALVAAMCFGMLFVFAVLVLLGKRFYEGYQRRHYSKMDYLINGMYN